MTALDDEFSSELGPSAWAGSVGSRWANNLDYLEATLENVADGILDHANFMPGETVVEIGCGGGAFTQLVAARVKPGGSVLGIDISDELIAIASRRAHAKQIGNLDFQTADASEARPASAPFDRLVSRFGVMFFPDADKAMRNLHRLLKPGGRLDFAVWATAAENAQFLLTATIADHLEVERPAPGAPGPLAFSDPSHVRTLLTNAGFSSIAIERWQGALCSGTPDMDAREVAERIIGASGFADALVKADAKVRKAVIDEAVETLTPYLTPQGVRLPATVLLVTAFA